MRNYVIINGVNSLTIQGLAINNLPPITKPMIRTQREEIDGRDGDIVTELGYSAYDKQIEIGLWGNYDINDIIKYFTGEGTIVFSNEEDKYYNFKILDQIDYEKLLKFKTATITLHCQPFKYPLEEEPVEAEIITLTETGENITLEDTEEAPMTINLKGNTSQATTTGKNLYNANDTTFYQTCTYVSGANTNQYKVKATGADIIINSQISSGTSYSSIAGTLIPCKYGETIYYDTGNSNFGKNIVTQYNSNKVSLGFSALNTGSSSGSYTPTDSNCEYISIRIGYGSATSGVEYTLAPIFSKTSNLTYEPYTNGASPNPDYPQDIHVVSGDNTINVVGKNLLLNIRDEGYTVTSNGITFKVNADKSITVTGTATNTASMNLNTGTPVTLTAGTYTLSKKENTDVQVAIWYDSASVWTAVRGTANTIQKTVSQDTTFNNWRTLVVVYQGVTVNTTVYPMLEKGSSATTYEAYKGNTYPVNLGVENYLPNNATTQTINGITYTINGDKSIKINGTASGRADIYLYGSNTDTGSYTYIPKGTYTMDTSNLLDGTMFLQFREKTAGVVYQTKQNNGLLTLLSQQDCYFYGIMLAVENGKTINNLTFYPQIEKGTKLNSYTPYGTTPIELCKIGDYQDYIYKDSGKWYLNKQISKAVLNGSESNWNVVLSSNLYRAEKVFNILPYTDTSRHIGRFICSHFYPNTNNEIGAIFQYQSTVLFYAPSGITTVEQWKTWLGNNNTTLYYVLATPTYTEITYQPLIDQLNLLEQAQSKDNQTNISQVNNDLPFELDVSVTFVVPMEINNIGNIYAKPILTIEGTGNIGVVLNDIQILEIDLTNNGKIAIDVTKLEAYNPDNNTLLNRLVTGDYMKLLINEGENTIKLTGNVSSATLTNYIRWI